MFSENPEINRLVTLQTIDRVTPTLSLLYLSRSLNCDEGVVTQNSEN